MCACNYLGEMKSKADLTKIRERGKEITNDKNSENQVS